MIFMPGNSQAIDKQDILKFEGYSLSMLTARTPFSKKQRKKGQYQNLNTFNFKEEIKG
ncbi:hypothetical protein NEOC84_001782|nr:hypothetical protein [Neochlamydia sp. AcF84]